MFQLKLHFCDYGSFPMAVRQQIYFGTTAVISIESIKFKDMKYSTTLLFILTYTGLPSIVIPPTDTHVFVGQDLELSCRGNEYTMRYQWLKDGHPLTSSPPFLLIEPGGGLVVQNATHCDSGVYTCEVSTEDWSNSASCVVIVTGPLLTYDGKRGRSGKEGGNGEKEGGK